MEIKSTDLFTGLQDGQPHNFRASDLAEYVLAKVPPIPPPPALPTIIPPIKFEINAAFINYHEATIFEVTLHAINNVLPTYNSHVPGHIFMIYVKQNGVGGSRLVLPNSLWGPSFELSMKPNVEDKLICVMRSDGKVDVTFVAGA